MTKIGSGFALQSLAVGEASELVVKARPGVVSTEAVLCNYGERNKDIQREEGVEWRDYLDHFHLRSI